MRKALAAAAGGLLFVLTSIAAVFVVGMRRRSPTVINAVRRLGRATKRFPMKSAGAPRAYASVVRHVGRATGREYETPVRAVATAEGFVVALPYGPDSDWVKNVLARGTAVIIHEGKAYRVEQPMLVPLDTAEDNFTAGDRRAHRLFGVTECITVRRAHMDELAARAARSAHRRQAPS